MRNLLLLLLFLSAELAYSQDEISLNDQKHISDLEYLSSLSPITEGSTSEWRSLRYIKKRLSHLKIPFDVFDYNNLDDTHSFSHRIEATIPGKKEDLLIIVLPINSPQGEERKQNGIINTAVGLSLAEKLIRSTPELTVKLLFMGGEFNPDKPIGSTHFLNSFYKKNRSAVIYLNLSKFSKKLGVKPGGKGIISPAWLTERTISSLQKNHIPFSLFNSEIQIFRLGIIDNPSHITNYLRKGYPSIYIEGGKETARDMKGEKYIDLYSSFFLSFLKSSGELPSSRDQHYLVFQIASKFLIIKESIYVLVIILVLSITLFVSLTSIKHTLWYLRTLLRNLRAFPLLLVLIFLFLSVAVFLLNIILFLKNNKTVWMFQPFLFFILKCLFLTLFFLFAFKFFNNLFFPKNKSFYSAAAIFLLLIDIIIFGILNISFSYYFIWAFIWTFLSSFFRNKLLKFLCMIISPFWLLKTAYDILLTGTHRASGILVMSGPLSSLMMSFIILPFILTAYRFYLIFQKTRKKKLNLFYTSAISLCSIAIVIIYLFLVLYNPYGKNNKQPLQTIDTINLDNSKRFISFTSPAPLGKIRIKQKNEFLYEIISNKKNFSIKQKVIPDILKINKNINFFLDRQNVKINILPNGRPYKINFSLSSEDNLIIFDSNFPFSLHPDSNLIDIHIGINPPVPLDVNFTLLEAQQVTVNIEIIYNKNLFPLELESKKYFDRKDKLVIRKSFRL